MILVSMSFTSILQDMFRAIFDAVLRPVLTSVLTIIINTIGALIQEVFSNWLLKLWVICLKLIDFLEDIFNVFLGLTEVYVDDVGTDLGFFDYLFQTSEVKMIVLGMTVIAFVLVFFATFIGVGKSMADMTFENKNPIGHVLGQSVKATFTVIMIPVTLTFAMMMVTNVMLLLNEYINYTAQDATIGDMIFITVASPAIYDADDIVDYSCNQAYTDTDAVKEDFDITEISYVQAYVSAIFVALLMLVMILQSIQRVFMLLLLYVVSPLIAAMIPLDDGAKFKDWRNMFTAYAVSAISPLLSMKIYFMVMSALYGATGSPSLDFGVSATLQSCVELLLVVGGAYAVFASRNVVVSIIDPMAAQAIESAGVVATMAKMKTMGMANKIKNHKSGKNGGQQSGGQQNGGQQKSASSNASNQYQSKSQAFSGK